MKKLLNNKEEKWFPAYMKIYLILMVLLISASCFSRCNAQSTHTLYRQTLIIGKQATTWQKVTVNYLDQIYQYNRKLTKRRKVMIVFGKEGTSPLSEWMPYVKKENDTIYNYKRALYAKDTICRVLVCGF